MTYFLTVERPQSLSIYLQRVQYQRGWQPKGEAGQQSLQPTKLDQSISRTDLEISHCRLKLPILHKEVSQTSTKESQVFNTLLYSDDILLSPIRFRSSPLSIIASTIPQRQFSPSRLLLSPSSLSYKDTVAIHYRFCFKDGSRKITRQLPKKRRLERAQEFYLQTQSDENSQRIQSLRRIAELYNINRKTLTRRLNGYKTRKEASIAQQKLLAIEQLTLISYITFLYKLGIPTILAKAG